jgi:hypothetical protein
MRRPKFALICAAAVLLATALVSTPGRTIQAGAASGIAFEVPSIVDPIHTFGEPDVAVDVNGRVFSSGPTGTGTQRSVWFGSVDRGRTYREISPCAAAPFPPPSSLGCPVPNALAGTLAPPGGGDTDIAFDHTGRQFFADLYALACLRTATTPDGGATVYQQAYPGGCGLLPGADRQWLAVFDPQVQTTSPYSGKLPLVYMEYNNLNGAQWVKSSADTDPAPGGPGLTYTNAEVDGPGTVTGYQPYGADGYPSIDQRTGNVFQASYGGDQPGTDPTKIYLNIGHPVDTTGQLKFLDAPPTAGGSEDPSKLIVVNDKVINNSGEAANFVVSSMDQARNLYVVWVNRSSIPSDRQVFVSAASPISPKGPWATWSPAVQVSVPTTLGDAVNVFPWIKAGGAGRADAVWYGSDQTVDPSAQKNQAWNVFMSQVVFPVDAQGHVTGAAPSKTLVKVSPHATHYNDICLAGSTCVAQQGNRNLADFFNITIDRSGAAEIVYDDTSNGLIQNPVPSGPIDHSGAPVVTVARQSAGPGLFADRLVTGPSATPVSGIPDNRGDALFPVIGGQNVPAMDLQSSQMQLSGSTLKVTTRVADLSPTAIASARATIPGAAFLQYVTRWQMGTTIYYAALEIDPTKPLNNQRTFFAGSAQSIDLCSVSACFPHILVYPEPGTVIGGGSGETGSVQCPATPSATNPCTVTINVNAGDIGNPTMSSLLEQVGSYSLVSAHRQGDITNAQALADDVPLEIDGACCYNFQASVANGGPPPCHEADGDGEIQGQRSGNATFHVDQDACEDQDAESVGVNDSGSGTDFHSNQIQSVSFDDVANTMTVSGSGTNAGHPVTFTMVTLNGPAGVGTFSLILSDGYVVSGTLLSGSVQL